MRRRKTLLSILLLLAVLAVGACRPIQPVETGIREAVPVGAAGATEAAVACVPSDMSKLEFLQKALVGEYKGTTVHVGGPFGGIDAIKFNDAVEAFEGQTGIDIQYEQIYDFEGVIGVLVDAGIAPDIADFPQPGLLGGFARQGKLSDLGSWMDQDFLKSNYLQSWLDMATMEGPSGPIMAGVWNRFNGKSLVWYPKKAFDEAGYTVPTTWEELQALMDMIKSDGDTPWCIGIESGVATGWPATDWMEEFMLRTTSLENYDKWTTGELPFSSPEVMNAAQKMSDLFLGEGNVYGGRAVIVSTSFEDALAPMFEDPPRCWLHKQGNFITSSFPAGLEPGVDYDVFYLPGIDEQYGKPFLVAGDIYAMFNDRSEVRAVMEYFATGESLKGWMKQGGALAPHKDACLDWYGDPVEKKIAALVAGATSVRFDGSDLMPGAVGAGSFWKAMTSFLAGTIDLATAMKEIDDSWPAPTAQPAGAVTQTQTSGERPAAAVVAEETNTQAEGTAESGSVKVALIYGVKGDPFQMTLQKGAQAKADELGVEFSADGPDHWTPYLQRPILDTVIAWKPSAICIAAVDPQALVEPLRAAFDAGINIFSVDTYIGDKGGDYTSGEVSFPLSYISSDNVEGGRLACQALIDAMGGKGKLYIQKAHSGIVTLDEREQGCREVVESSNGAVELVGVDVCEASPDVARFQMLGVLKRVPDLGGVFGTDLYCASGAWEAVQNAGLGSTVEFAVFDTDDAVIEALRNDLVDIVVAQHPYEMGQKCIEYAVAAARGDIASIPKRSTTGYTIITRDNVDTEEGQQAIYGGE